MENWKRRVVQASLHTQTGAIVAHVLNLETENQTPRFVGNGTVTSDGFVMCDFIDARGEYHMGAFVGALSDLKANVKKLGNYCNLVPLQQEEMMRAVLLWAGVGSLSLRDWRPVKFTDDDKDYVDSAKAQARIDDARDEGGL